ncbi:MAG: MFS transporter [Balneolaceae bacterium]
MKTNHRIFVPINIRYNIQNFIQLSYLTFVLQERKVLSFGLSFTFFSNFGQTFLISLFVPFFLTDFNLSNTAFGSIYSVATLSSAVILPYLGKWIDVMPIHQYSLYVALGLLTASLMVAFSWHIGFLFAGILMLRLAGQGLSSHTAETTMARYFKLRRGKALSISSLGYPLGEGLLPLAVAALLALTSWRLTWGIIAATIALVFIPFILFLLKRSGIENAGPEDNSKPDEEASVSQKNIYSSLINNYRFWLFLPAVLLPAFWATALFLYQVSIAESLGWTATIIASAFIFFAVARIISALSIGPLIDRWGARQIFPFYLLPLAAGLFVAYLHPGIWSAFLYMSLLGITMGIGSTTKSALWAELYGTNIIGTVRSLFTSLMVFSTAISPFLMGWMLDHQIPITTILMGAVITVLIGTVMAFFSMSGNPKMSKS